MRNTHLFNPQKDFEHFTVTQHSTDVSVPNFAIFHLFPEYLQNKTSQMPALFIPGSS
jgi:hypothetical protein